MKPDIFELQKFLREIEPDSTLDTVWCWQIVRKPVPQPFGLPSISKTWHFHESVRDALPQLTMENAAGAAIFVTINETDGTGRKVENIKRVRAIFVDLDGAPLEPVQAARYQPHLIVNTSPGKYHAYWRVKDIKLDDFKPLQQALAREFNGDPSVCDVGRVMRVPGFYHHKAEPALVTCMEWSGMPPRSVADWKKWLKPNKPIKHKPMPMPEHLAEEVTRVLPTIIKMGLHQRPYEGGRHEITCPWAHHHTQGGDTAAYFEPGEMNNWRGAFRCLHSHCAERGIHQLQKFVSLYLGERHDG